MPAQTPEQCDELVIAAIVDKDIETAMALYEPTASFVVGGEFLTGLDSIRKALEEMMSMDITFNVESIKAVPDADGAVAVTRAKGTSTAPGPDGKPVTTPFHSVEVVRKQADGTWKFIVDDPGGDGIA